MMQQMITAIPGDSLKIVVRLNSDREFVKLALKFKLFNHNGVLESMFKAMLNRMWASSIISLLMTQDNTPVGVCLLLRNNTIQVFVKPNFREKGWGERLVKETIAAKNIDIKRVKAGPGADFLKSVEFWRKCNVGFSEGIGSISLPKEALMGTSGSEICYRKKFFLSSKDSKELPEWEMEEIYLSGLYDTLRTNGLKDQLACFWKERYLPFERIYFHISAFGGKMRLLSLATVSRDFYIDSSDSKPSFLIRIHVKKNCRHRGLASEIFDQIQTDFPNQRCFLYGSNLLIRPKVRIQNGLLSKSDAMVGDVEGITT